MRFVLGIFCAGLFGMLAWQAGAARLAAPDDDTRAAALTLFKSLSDDQKKLALKDFGDKDRYAEIFPVVKRAGLQFSMLNAEQKKLADDVIKAMTSDYGAGRCLEVAKQTPADGRYLNFYGEPSAEQIGRAHV